MPNLRQAPIPGGETKCGSERLRSARNRPNVAGTDAALRMWNRIDSQPGSIAYLPKCRSKKPATFRTFPSLPASCRNGHVARATDLHGRSVSLRQRPDGACRAPQMNRGGRELPPQNSQECQRRFGTAKRHRGRLLHANATKPKPISICASDVGSGTAITSPRRTGSA